MKPSPLAMFILALVVAPMLLVASLDFLSTRNANTRFLSSTEISLDDCKRDIQRYAIQHNVLPISTMKGCWGHPIRYSVDSNGMVTLSNYGEDNKPGGTGNDEDCIGIYPSRQSNGKWSDETVPWTVDPASNK